MSETAVNLNPVGGLSIPTGDRKVFFQMSLGQGTNSLFVLQSWGEAGQALILCGGLPFGNCLMGRFIFMPSTVVPSGAVRIPRG